VLRRPLELKEYTGELFRAAVSAGEGASVDGPYGSALDNAVAESFNSTLEFELLADVRFATRAQARAAVAGFIDEYHTQRRHSSRWPAAAGGVRGPRVRAEKAT
jgi:putative transposase